MKIAATKAAFILAICAMHAPDSVADVAADSAAAYSNPPTDAGVERDGGCQKLHDGDADSLGSGPVTLATVRCLVDRGQTALAVLYLQRILARDESNPEAAALLERQLRQSLRARKAGQLQTPWGALAKASAWLAMELGHDSNINRATSAEVIDIPLLNYRSLALPELLVERSSGFAGLTGGAAVRVPLLGTIEASVQGQAGIRGNYSETAYVPHNYRVTARVDGVLGETSIGGEVSTAQQWVAKYRLLERTSARIDLATNMLQTTGLAVSAEWGNNAYPQFSGVRTSERSVEVRALYRPFNLHLGAYWGEESSRDTIKDLDRVFEGVSAGWRHRISDSWRLAIDVSTGRSRYGQFSRLFAARRTDLQSEISVALPIQLSDRWSLTPRIVAERNDSSITLNRYRRTQYLAELRRDF